MNDTIYNFVVVKFEKSEKPNKNGQEYSMLKAYCYNCKSSGNMMKDSLVSGYVPESREIAQIVCGCLGIKYDGTDSWKKEVVGKKGRGNLREGEFVTKDGHRITTYNISSWIFKDDNIEEAPKEKTILEAYKCPAETKKNVSKEEDFKDDQDIPF